MNQQTDLFEFPQLQLQIDPLKSSCHHQLNIENIPILFPQRPYEVQEKYMRSVIQALNSQSNALLQSPTGTGKTLALLCATLAWISQSRKKIRIIYSSRTHSQLKQVANELSRTAYKPRVSMLGSRKHLCINDNINKLDETKLNKSCNKLRRHDGCQYYNKEGIEQAALKLQDSVLEIEELKTSCKENVVCPFYLERQRNEDADITLLPYNYLLTMKLKGYINLENSIIIFDEAHNVVQAAEDGQSFSLSQESLKKGHQKLNKWKDEMNNLGVAHQDYRNPEQLINISDNLKRFYNHLNQLLDFNFQKPDCQSFNGIQIIKIMSYYFSEGNRDTNYMIELFLNDQQYNITQQQIEQFQVCCTNLHQQINRFKIHPGTQLKNILKFFGSVNNLFNVLLLDEKQPIDSFKLFIEKDSNNQEIVLSMKCFDPSIGFSHIVSQQVYSIIITSGTLKPFDFWAQELNMQFRVRLDNPHLDGITNNVKGFILKQYNFSYNDRENYEQSKKLGEMILQSCDIIPSGILVVFSSYNLMGSIRQKWNEATILYSLQQKKQCFWEPENTQDLQEIFQQYQQNAKTNGAILFCVQRGKVSEGIDFSDELCRAVFLVGVPYLPIRDIKVIEKMNFLPYPRRKEWYFEQANRTTNQSLGRVIRHKMDYGAIYLCDSRFQNKTLPEWVQPSIQTIDYWKLESEHYNQTKEFFQQKESQYRQVEEIIEKRIQIQEQL